MRKIYSTIIAIFFATGVFAQSVTVTGADATTNAGSPYATLGAAFGAINAAAQTSNNITITLTANTTETATATLNAGTWTTVTIRASTPVTVNGNIVGALIKLNGADNVTIDGRIAGSGRNITVSNASNNGASATVWLSSLGAGQGATNNIIRNLEIAGGVSNNNTNGTFGIIMSGTTISTTSNGEDNDNNQFIFNRIIRARYGLVTRGAATNLNIAPIITDNTIGAGGFGPDEISKTGMLLQSDTNALVTRNTVQFIGGNFANATNGADRVGIAIGSESWSATTTVTLSSAKYTVTNNTIHDIVEERTFSAIGILLATTQNGAATNNLVANNFIYNIRSNGTLGDQVCGIGIVGGNGDKVEFNSLSITSDMDPGSTEASAQFGNAIRISTNNSTNNANLSLRNNSIYLDANSNAATTHFYAISLASASYVFGTGGLNYNNYYINATNPQLSTGGLSNTSAASATTEFATLGNWKTALTAPQDANSIQADPGYYANTADLHIAATSPNINVGTATGSVTSDIDAQARPNGANPEIGADEFYASPGVIKLADGYTVNEGNTLALTVYRTAGNVGAVSATVTFTNGTATGGAACSAGVDYVNPGPTVVTFANGVISQVINIPVCTDAVAEPSETFTATLSLPTGGATLAVPTTATINITDVPTPLSGTYTVGTGGNYPSLTNAGGIFEALNLAGASADITINIVSDLSGETGAVALNELPVTRKVIIKPSGAARVVTGSAATSLVKLFGADNVTIDGSLNGGTDRSLTFNNTAAGTLVWIGTNATSGATNDTIKNCVFTGIVSGQGIIAGSGTTLGAAAEFPNSSNAILNNAVSRVQNAVFISGNVASPDQNWTVSNNDFGSSVAADKLTFRGILIGSVQNFMVAYNTISGINSSASSSANMTGIQVAFSVTGGLIKGNIIKDIRQVTTTTGYGSTGITLGNSNTAANVTLVNNFISDIASYGNSGITASDNGNGIAVVSGGGYKIYNNSVSLSTNQTATTSITSAINIAAAVVTPGSLDIRNNILSNTETIGTQYAVYNASTAGNAIFSTIDYNNYNAAIIGFQGSARATLADWQAATTQDANSISVTPDFVNAASDLHLTPLTACATTGKGVSITAVTDDIDLNSRNNPPFIGAHEAYEPATTNSTLETVTGSFRTYLVAGATDFLNNCKLIARLTPNGASPVSGSTTTRVWVEATQPAQFVKRHYEINTPNAATATGRVTLYFTDAEFNDFNTQIPSPGSLLPVSTNPSTITSRKANLRIEKRGGISSDNTGLPTTYSGPVTTIDPADADIVWNSVSNRWEVSFDATGFSGFFVKTTSTALPLTWLDITGSITRNGNGQLNWKVAEQQVNFYELQRGADGLNFDVIGTVTSKGDGTNNYTFTDNTPIKGVMYYRVRQFERDGRTTYSRVIKLSSESKNVITVYPNPSKNLIRVTVGTNLLGTFMQMTDVSGRLLQQITVNNTAFMLQLESYSAGIYFLKGVDGSIQKIIKE